MRIEVWTTKSKGTITYHAYFDEFESLPQDLIEVVEKEASIPDTLMFQTTDPQVLIKKILKNVEKEVKHQIKNDK